MLSYIFKAIRDRSYQEQNNRFWEIGEGFSILNDSPFFLRYITILQHKLWGFFLLLFFVIRLSFIIFNGIVCVCNNYGFCFLFYNSLASWLKKCLLSLSLYLDIKAAVLDGFSKKNSKEVEYSVSELKCRFFLSIWATLKLWIEDVLGVGEFMSVIYRKQLLNF